MASACPQRTCQHWRFPSACSWLRKLTSWGATLQTSYTTWVRRESTVVAQYCAYLCGIQYTVYFERSSQSLKNYSASFTFMQPLLVYTHARHLQAGMHSKNPPILVVAEERVTSNNNFQWGEVMGRPSCVPWKKSVSKQERFWYKLRVAGVGQQPTFW